VKVADVYELPIMLIRTLPLIRLLGTTALQLDSTGRHQQKASLHQFADHAIPLVVFHMHFFSFCKRKQPDRPFEPLIITGINPHKIGDFDTVLEIVTKDKRFNVVTVSELWNIFRENPDRFQAQAFIPRPGFLPTYIKCY